MSGEGWQLIRSDPTQDRTGRDELRLDVPFDERRAFGQCRLLGNDARQLADLLGEVVAALRQAGELGHQIDVGIVANGTALRPTCPGACAPSGRRT